MAWARGPPPPAHAHARARARALPSLRSMTVRLAVAGAFHTSYMSPAVAKLKAALEATPMKVGSGLWWRGSLLLAWWV
jgi:hypothetical protein